MELVFDAVGVVRALGPWEDGRLVLLGQNVDPVGPLEPSVRLEVSEREPLVSILREEPLEEGAAGGREVARELDLGELDSLAQGLLVFVSEGRISSEHVKEENPEAPTVRGPPVSFPVQRLGRLVLQCTAPCLGFLVAADVLLCQPEIGDHDVPFNVQENLHTIYQPKKKEKKKVGESSHFLV